MENIWTDRCGDLVLVEAETSKHKTSKSKQAKTSLAVSAVRKSGVNVLYSIEHD